MSQKPLYFKREAAFFWGVPALLWQILFLYVPLAFLISTSLVTYVIPMEGNRFTFEHYYKLWNAVSFLIIFRSLFAAAVTVIVCLLLAYPVAYYLTLKVRKRLSNILFSLLVLPFLTNVLLLIYSWYFLLERTGLVNTILLKLGIISQPLHLINSAFAIYCGFFYCYFPFMLLPLYSSLEKLDKRLLEASYDLGANPAQTFWRVTVPQTWSGIKTGALLVFIPALGDFVVPAILGGDKTMYVGSVIAHFFLTIRDNSLGSAFTCLLSMVLIALLLVERGLKYMYCSMTGRTYE